MLDGRHFQILPPHNKHLVDLMYQAKRDHKALHHFLEAILCYPHVYPVIGSILTIAGALDTEY